MHFCAIVPDVGDVVVSMLDRPVSSYAETDRLLRLTPSTARRWIDGYERAGREYPPVIRARSSKPSCTRRPVVVPPEPRARPLEGIRFYVDEDILGIGYALMWLRADVITCGVEPVADELPRQIRDIEWIPRVAGHGWVAITGDRKIRTNPIEAKVATGSGARIVCFASSSGNRTSRS